MNGNSRKQLAHNQVHAGKLVLFDAKSIHGIEPTPCMILTDESEYHSFQILIGETVATLIYLRGTLNMFWYITTGVDSECIHCKLYSIDTVLAEDTNERS